MKLKYLGRLFSDGAVLVNLYGSGVGDASKCLAGSKKNGPAQVKNNLEKATKEKRFDAAAQAANAILKTIEK